MDNPAAPHFSLRTQFKPGQTGNPGGRPRGVDVRRRSVEAASLAVWERIVEQSLDGNLDAAALVLEHLRANTDAGAHRASPAGQTPSPATGEWPNERRSCP